MIDSPSGGALAKAPRWDLADIEGYGGGNSFSLAPWMFLGYAGLYRRKKYVGGNCFLWSLFMFSGYMGIYRRKK